MWIRCKYITVAESFRIPFPIKSFRDGTDEDLKTSATFNISILKSYTKLIL